MTNHTPGTAGGTGSHTTAEAGASAAGSAADRLVLRPPLTTRLRPWHWVAIDGVIAVLLAAVFLVGSTDPAYGIPLWVAYLLALASTLPSAARRLWPLPVLGVVLAGSVAAMAIGTGKDPSVVAAFVLYLVGFRYPRRGSAAVLAGVLALTAAATVAGGAALAHDQAGGVATRAVTSAVVITAGWVIGVAVRAQRAYTAGLREQAERRTREQLAEGRRALTEERLRIARELHDVVAHSLSLIAVQAGVGHYVAGARPDEAARALASIEATSRGALREMRRLLGVLRDDSAGADLAPAHGLADVGQLITGTADAGVRVQLEVRGAQRPVPPGVDLAAYRIIQEALTNVVKHARTTASRVTVTYEDDAIGLDITDDGHGARADAVAATVGHGIAGMRERASLFGGELHAGPLPGRGVPGRRAAAAGQRAGRAGRPGHRMIRVLVADDQALVRGSFRLLVDIADDLQVIGEAATGAEALEIAIREKPDVLLMDIRMPAMDGIEATRQITKSEQTADVRVLILTTFDLDEYVYAALRAGASGFLLKDTPPADLLAAIRVIAAGDALIAPAITRRLIAEFARRPEPGQQPAATLEGITDREREVLTLIARGLSNAEIAHALHVTMATAKTHVGRLLAKLGARDRAQLVMVAYETGLVQPG